MSLFPPSMLTSPDPNIIADLTIDELRWLEASEILDFPTSPTDSYHLNDRVVLSRRFSRFTEDLQRPEARTRNTSRLLTPTSTSPFSTRDAKRSTAASHGLPTPPRTPPRRTSPSQLNIEGSPSEWLYRRPKTPSTSRVAPSTSALSSTLTLTPSLQPRTQPDVHDKFKKPASGSEVSGNAPFWSTMLRPRSRSTRSIPLLKTIPSQSQVDLHDSELPLVNETSEPIRISRRSPSISSTSSSTLSTATSSSHPETPVSTLPDPFRTTVKSNKGYHRRHVSQPSSQGYRLPVLSSSCPSKSILTRTSSISTKDSVATANKSVKFVEIPTVHYASAGWDAHCIGRKVYGHDDMGIDMDEMDMSVSASGSRWDAHVDYHEFSIDSKASAKGLKRLVSLNRRSSVSTAPPSTTSSFSPPSPTPSSRRKSSASTISTATIRPKTSKALPPTPTSTKFLPTIPSSPPKPLTISGPYVLGSHPSPASPAHSTVSLRSTHKHKPKTKSTPSAAMPSSSPSSSSMYHHALEACRGSKNSAARSVRSLGSVRSESSTAPRLKSWLNRVGVGNGWSMS